MLRVRMLGQLSLQLNETPVAVQSRPAQSLLALLMLTAGVAHRREQLAGTLWPNTRDSNARDYLRHELWRLNRALQQHTENNAGFFMVNKISVAFNPDAPFWLDARQLAEISTRTDVPIEEELSTAFLYQGELLPGFYEDWVNPYRAQAHAFFDMLMPRLLSHLRGLHRFKDAVHVSRHWIMHGELPENAYRELMLAHFGLNDQAAIRQDMDACATHLHKQYGARPSRMTVDLYQSLIDEQQAGA